MPLKKIILELARTPEFPNGSSTHGYEFVAPLDADGMILVKLSGIGRLRTQGEDVAR